MVHLVYCDDKEKILYKIIEENQGKLNLSKKQQERWHKKCMCLIEFQDVKEIE